MTDQHLANAASRDRIRSIAARAAAGPVPAVDDDGGWGPAVVLAHVGFWDRMALARWHRADADGEAVPPPLAANVSDFINAAGFPGWSVLDVETAAGLALDAAAAIDAYLEALPPDRAQAARVAGFGRLVDRSLHRNEHLDSIERTL
ncbi:MAG: hypothetical protein FJ038_05975 [Chloroflexi bacterium]|nr:hypothetical protein [Chloroflexota bacterium]